MSKSDFHINRCCNVTGRLLSAPDGADTAEYAIQRVVRWIEDKTRFSFSEEEQRGNISIKVEDPNFQIEAYRVVNNDRSYFWMLQYRHPCQDVSTRTWITEIAVGRSQDGVAHFGVRLNFRDVGTVGAKIYNTPRIVRELIDMPGAVIDQQEVYSSAKDLAFPEDFKEYSDLFSLQKRKLPVVLISEHKEDGYLVNPDYMARQLAGIAHVFKVDTQTAFRLKNIWPNEIAAFSGSIRVTSPQASLESYDRQHNRLFLHRDYCDRNSALRQHIRFLAFEQNLERTVSRKEFPTFAELKRAYNVQARLLAAQKLKEADFSKRGKPDNASASGEATQSTEKQKKRDTLKELEEDLRSQITALTEQMRLVEDENSALQSQVEEALSLAAEEEERHISLRKENERLVKSVDEMEAQLGKAAHVRPNVLKQGRIFPDLSEVKNWAEACFPEELIITGSAMNGVKAAPKDYRHTALVYQSLILLARQRRNTLLFMEIENRHGGARDLVGEFEKRAHELHLEDRFSIKKSQASLYGSTYYAEHEGDRFFLDRHLTRGAARDPKSSFRIYYSSELSEERIVVGHLPTHLVNSKT